MKERNVKGQNGTARWERRRKCVKTNEGALLATRKENISLNPSTGCKKSLCIWRAVEYLVCG